MPNPNNNKTPATVGEVVRLIYQYSRCVEDSVDDKLLFQQRIEECVSSLIEQLRMEEINTNNEEYNMIYNTAVTVENFKIDDMLK